MSRYEAESDLVFVGFIIFENKLKPSTAGVLRELNDARIRNVMCTGDNILTAISVARECSLIDRTGHCFVPRFLTGVVPGQHPSVLNLHGLRRLTNTTCSLELGERGQPKISARRPNPYGSSTLVATGHRSLLVTAPTTTSRK